MMGTSDADIAAYLQPVGPGQLQIEHHAIGAGAHSRLRRGGEVITMRRLEPLELQQPLQLVAQGGVVFHHIDERHGPLPPSPRQRYPNTATSARSSATRMR